jgi:hypothetical protein
MMGFASCDTANHAIEHGIFIEAKHVQVCKLLQEPKRCVKCQSLDGKHVVAECSYTHDVCGRCASLMHHMADCPVTDPQQFACYNCKGNAAKGHGAADRHCPAFTERVITLQARNPELKYRFFPTDDPKMWETTEAMTQQANSQENTWHDGLQRSRGQSWTQGGRQTGFGWEGGETRTAMGTSRVRGMMGGGTRDTADGFRGGRGGRGIGNIAGPGSRRGSGRRGEGREIWPVDRLRQQTLGDAIARQANGRHGAVTGANTTQINRSHSPRPGTRPARPGASMTGATVDNMQGTVHLSWADMMEVETMGGPMAGHTQDTWDPASAVDDHDV